jgi:type IV secretory pathway VirB2 component (pilin)
MLLCSSEDAPIECKSILANLSLISTDGVLTSRSTSLTSSTSMSPSSSSASNGVLHEILPYVTGGLVILMIYVISVCFLRYGAKLSWIHAISLALGLIFKGQDSNPCCVCHQTTYTASVGAAIPTASPDLPDISRRGGVRPLGLNVQETSV